MRRGVYAHRHPGNDGEAGIGQRGRKQCCRLFAPGCGIAAADNGQPRRAQQFATAFQEQHHRGIGNFHQQWRIIRVRQREQMVLGLTQPKECSREFCRVGACDNRAGYVAVDERGQRRMRQ